MNSTKISLAIFGNQNSNSGFQPLYWINDPPQQLENIMPPGMDENLYFFTLQVLPAHTQYTLIQNRVSSYMSVRPGVLKMAIAIPKGYRISGGVSPMAVLLEVRKAFLETCMTMRDAHVEAYNFKEKLAAPEIFTAIVDAYHLEPDAQQHLPMTGTEDSLLLLNDAAIAQLFMAPQRPEFTRFKRIVIANKGNAAVYKSTTPYEPTSEVVTIRTVKKEVGEAVTTPHKPFPWKKAFPALLCLPLIGVTAFLVLNTSSTTSVALADNDAEMTEDMTGVFLDEPMEESTEKPTEKPMEKPTEESTKEPVEKPTEEAADSLAQVIEKKNDKKETDTLTRTDTLRRQEQPAPQQGKEHEQQIKKTKIYGNKKCQSQ